MATAIHQPGDEGLGHDLTACDREPIHIPGAIQPHGLLLVIDPATACVVAGAGDLEGRLDPDWLGAPAAQLLGQPLPAEVATPFPLAPVAGRDIRFDATLHRTGDYLAVELVPVPDAPRSAGEALAWLDAKGTAFERAAGLEALCATAAAAFRELTGFDRVMLYRFVDDAAGQVIAEDRDPALHSFMNHHFPASDIPRQARALYVRNRTRLIADIAYTPAPIRPAAAGLAQLDLSDVAIRSVSPIHLQYLANMGVGASASVSIVKDGVLWGLVACHHATPRLLSQEVLATARTMAGGLARQIRAREEADAYRERLRLRGAADAILAALAGDEPLEAVLRHQSEALRALLGGDGFARVSGRTVDRAGRCPATPRVRDIARFVAGRNGTEPFSTRELSAAMPDAADVADCASGVLALPLDRDETLLWFRAEQVEEVEWAGNPHKAVEQEPGAVLTPRASFASWTEAVRGRSRRWTLEEVEAARRLRRALADARAQRQLRQLNRQLGEAVAQKDTLLAQKDVLMKEVNHRVQNSLQLVQSFLGLQARAAGPEAAPHLAEAQARLSAVALVHRRLYRDDQIETVELSRYLQELAEDMGATLGPEWQRHMTLDLAPVLIPTDRAVTIGLIMVELLINATKYAYARAAGPLAITLEEHRDRFRLIVADQGVGLANSGTGFGSRMMTAMVSRLDGEIEFADNAPGLRAILTAPVND